MSHVELESKCQQVQLLPEDPGEPGPFQNLEVTGIPRLLAISVISFSDHSSPAFLFPG